MTAPEPVEVPADELAAAEDCPSCAQMKAWYAPDGNHWRAYNERLIAERDRLRADLARALPVVEAAGAVESWWSDMRECYSGTEENDQLVDLLDALATSAVRAAREPRTGEGG